MYGHSPETALREIPVQMESDWHRNTHTSFWFPLLNESSAYLIVQPCSCLYLTHVVVAVGKEVVVVVAKGSKPVPATFVMYMYSKNAPFMIGLCKPAVQQLRRSKVVEIY